MTEQEKLEEAKRLYTTANADQKYVLESLFPQLKESEDERIRKAIIDFFSEPGRKEYILKGFTVDDILAWLEKQGIIVEEYEDKLDRVSCESFDKGYKAALEKQGEQKSIIIDLDKMVYEFAHTEVKGYGMPAMIEVDAYRKGINDTLCLLLEYGAQLNYIYQPNKVEPKFKVGDWIANDYCMGKVIALTDDAYLLDTEQGIPFSCEHNAHLWTIQDAKPGDVLQLGEVTAIFKEYIGNGNCKCYCSVYRGEFEIPTQDSSYGCHNATPATKEQRDTLFAKMHEAGYEWDAEKLELIKVPKIKEPEGALKQLLDEQEKLYKEAEIILENKDTALAFLKRTGIIDENGELSEKYRSDQTPATTISVGNGINSTAITDGNTSVTSEEVERQYCTGQYEPDVREFPIEWKPSDEQMDALQYVFRNINPPLSDKLGWGSIKTLELLYHDLKKLKEE